MKRWVLNAKERLDAKKQRMRYILYPMVGELQRSVYLKSLEVKGLCSSSHYLSPLLDEDGICEVGAKGVGVPFTKAEADEMLVEDEA